MHLLGLDIGSSSVKVSLINGENGELVASAFSPKKEMKITAHKAGWAEQEPEQWWENFKIALAEVQASAKIDPESIKAIGISYQMHGLVMVDKNKEVIRPSIIWSDVRTRRRSTGPAGSCWPRTTCASGSPGRSVPSSVMPPGPT